MTNHFAITSRASPTAETEADAFAQLYREHTCALFNYCLYCVGDPAVAEDLAADAFERAWKARRRYNPRRAQFSTWLFTIARRVVTDWQRRQARRRMVGLDERLPSARPGPDALTEEAEEQSRLRQLVRALSRKDQDLIAMKFGAGMTNRQIAKVVGKSETAVGSALHRLVHKLRIQWEEADE